jgi:SAM-dependent methyltransferase
MDMITLRILIVEVWFKLIDLLLLVIPARTLLRFLLRVDNNLYKTIAYLAHKWEGGEHPKHRLMEGYHEFFVENVSTNDAVLDVGCGTGVVAWKVAERAKWVVGIDGCPHSIEWARQHYMRDNLEFICGRAPEALPEEHFDVIMLSNVLEHLQQRTEFLRRLIQGAGARRILIRVPVFSRDWRVPLKKELGIEWRSDGTHEIEYELESFYDEMESAGLACESVSVKWGEIYAVCYPEAS